MSDRAEIDRTLIGAAADPFTVDVERGAIARFAEAIGDSASIYFDDGFAQSLGYAGVVAPPTFPTTFRSPSRPAWLLGLDEGRILAGEQAFQYSRPIVAGDRLRCQLHFAAVEDKHGSIGKMELLVQNLVISDASGQMVCINRRVVIYRSRVAA
jgi:hypothetical protein